MDPTSSSSIHPTQFEDQTMSQRADPALRARILELNIKKYIKDNRPTETGGDWYTLYKHIKATTEDALPGSSVATEWCEFVFKHLTDAGSWNPGTFPKVRACQTFQYLLHWHNPEPKAQADRQRGGQGGISAHTRGMASTRMLAQPMLDMMVRFLWTGTDSFDPPELTPACQARFPRARRGQSNPWLGKFLCPGSLRPCIWPCICRC